MNITLLELIEYIKKHIPMIVTVGVIAAVISFVYVWQNQSYTASTTIKYTEADTETGLDKTGTKIDPYEIMSPRVIEDAVKSLGTNTSVEEIRSSITITPFIDETTRKTQEALIQQGETFEYYPNEYQVALTHHTNDPKYGIQIMNKLLESYDEYVRETHTNAKKVADIFTGIDYSKYDYMEICDLYSEQLTSIIDLMSSLNSQSPEYRSPKTGLTFGNLLYYFNSLQNMEYTKLYSYVREGRLSKNPEMIIKNYTYKIEELSLAKAKSQEEANVSFNLMNEFYKQYKEGKVSKETNTSDADSNSGYIFHEEDKKKLETTYDNIITNYVNSGVSASNSDKSIQHYQMLIESFTNDTVSPEIKAVYKEKADKIIVNLDEQMRSYIDMANETLNSYNAYKGTQYISYLSSVSSKPKLSPSIIIIFGIVAGLCAGMLIAVLAEILKKLREEAAVEAKRKRQNLIESGTLPKNYESMPPLDRALFEAVSGGFEEFKVYYQPVVDKNGKPVGAEALVRWDSKEFGLVMPSDFIAIAEKYDIMEILGKWIVNEACKQCKIWNEQIDPDFFVSVNFTLSQVSGQIFMDCVFNAVNTVGIRAKNLMLEISNGGDITDIDATSAKLRALKTSGIKVAVDNFNNENSSVEALYKLPLDLVKIARRHIQDISQSINDQNFVTNIVNIAAMSEIDVAAEGVEQKEQMDMLLKLGVEYMQGYYYSRPITGDEFTAYITSKQENK